MSGATPAPPDTADSATRSQWLTRNAAARLAICNHLPLAECAHFEQHRTAQTLYDAVVTRYSSPTTAALGRLLLPYLFPELSTFATVEDLVSHHCTSNARYRDALPAEFLDSNPAPMYITLYFIVTRLPDSLRSLRDHFLSLDPTFLTVDLLEQHLASETSAVAIGAACGTPRTPFFEGCSPSPLAPSYASAAAVDVLSTKDVRAASASAKRRSSKGKGGKGGGGGSGSGGGGSSGGSEGGGSGGSGGGSGGSGSGGSGGSGSGGSGGNRTGAQRGGSEGGQRQRQQHRSKTPSPQQLREWLFQRGASGGSHRCFSRLDDAWHAEFGDEVERPHWAELLRSRVAIFDLDYDAILSAMYALSASTQGDCSRCVPPDPGIATAALGASESVLPGTAPAEALHTFTLDSAALQDAMVTTTTPGGQRVSICTCTQMGRHLATFTRRPRSSLYTLATKPPQVAAFALVSASRQVAPPCLCRLLSHQTLLWNRRLGHPSLPCLRGMHSCFLVFGLPRSLPPLPPSPAPPCLPCIEGRQRAAPHSSLFPPTIAPLQTLRMDVWGPARVSGQGCERYFLLVDDDYTRYTTVFPLCSKGEVVDVLIPWIRSSRLQLRERFCTDLPVLRLYSDRGGEFSSDLLREFCRGEGILQSFTLLASAQQNGIAERRIGLVMEVARTSMIHASAPHFLWPFAVQYAAHQLNLWPCVSLPETSPTLRWTGKVGNASVFRVLDSRAFVHHTFADKLSARAIFCVYLGFPPDSVPFYGLFPYRSAPPPPPPIFLAPGPPPVEPVPPLGPAPSGVSQVDPLPSPALVEVAVDSFAARGAVSEGAAFGGAEPGVAESEGAGSGGAEPGGEEPAGAEPAGVEPGGAEPKGVETGSAESEGAESGGAEPQGAASSGGPAGASPRLSPQQLREWLVRRARLRSGATGAGGARAARAGDARYIAGAGSTGGVAAAGPRGARTWGTGVSKTGGVGGDGVGDPTEPGAAGAGGSGAGGAGGTGGAGAGGAGVGDTLREAQELVALPLEALELEALEMEELELLTLEALCSRDHTSFPCFSRFLLASPLPTLSPYTEQSGGLTERREPASHPILHVRTARRVPRSRPPLVPGMHAMALRPSSVSLRVPLPAPPKSSLPAVPDPACDRARATSPTVPRLLAIAVTDPSFESATSSALVAELLDFAAGGILHYAIALVAESASAIPPSVGGECALGTDVLEDRQEDFECLVAAIPRFASMLLAPEGDPDAPDILTPCSYAEAVTGPYSSQWQAAMDAKMASWKSTGTYVDKVPPPRENIVDGMLIFRVKRPPGSPPAFERDYELHSLDFSTAFLQGSLHEEIWLRHPPGFTGTFLTTLAALGFAPSTADASLFLHTDTSLPPFYVLVYVLQCLGFQFSSPQPTPLSTGHSLSAAPSDESVEPTYPYPELVDFLIYLMTCTRPDLAYPLSLLARYVALGRHRNVNWDAAKRVLRYLCSTSGMGLVLGGRARVVLTGHAHASWVDDSAMQRSSQGYTFSLAMAAQELRWLTYLLTDLVEQPRSPPQRGQLRLAYVATRANTADIFTKALPPGDHQRFSIVLGLVPTLPHLLTA
ncbi:unnamed protein product [Closterium sp. NIES-53]